MIDKEYCMSSYMAFRYVEKEDVNFYEGLRQSRMEFIPANERILVSSSKDIDKAIKKEFEELKGQRLGLLISGGMDSASLAAYLEPGTDAYTFRFLDGTFEKEELKRAEIYSDYYGLNLHYVDINWNVVKRNLIPIMKGKNAPVHSIEPQLYQAALQAQMDGVEKLIVGESADLIFGGMDQLLAKDWTVEAFSKRYMFTNPFEVLSNPKDMNYLFERYRIKNSNKIDFLTFMDNVFSVESSNSYFNAFAVAGMPYVDPYAKLKMAESLNLNRVRSGEPKYLIRELFAMKYPGFSIPFKLAMPRPVENYFKTWEGPKRPEFQKNIDINKFSGNQKWQMYCLEEFLNMHEPLSK